MAITFSEFDVANAAMAAAIKQRILASSDWAHLQLSSGTQDTTLSSTAASGATSISTAATIPSGSYVTIWRNSALNGASVPETRITTGVSGSGPYTVTFADALTAPNGTYQSGDRVGVGSYVKATTTRGAQMVIDLADAAPSTTAMQYGVYVTHDGTTAGAKTVRYTYFRRTSGATTNVEHCRVSASKEWVYIETEGPRGGETGAQDANTGSYRSILWLGDVVPYWDSSADPYPVVCLVGGTTGTMTGADVHTYVHLSRDRGGTKTWTVGRLATLTYPMQGKTTTTGIITPQAKNGDWVTAPWVVYELEDGLRGRLANLHYAGFNYGPGTTDAAATLGDINPPPPGTEMVYGSYKYRCLAPFKCEGLSGNECHYSFGHCDNRGNSSGAYLWVPVAAYP